jgi:hypothetical protein
VLVWGGGGMERAELWTATLVNIQLFGCGIISLYVSKERSDLRLMSTLASSFRAFFAATCVLA